MPVPTPIASELFGVGSMNIPAANKQKGDLPPATVTKIAKTAEPQVGLLATQETIEPEDNTALDKALSPDRWWHFTAKSENDLFVKKARWAPCPPDRLPTGVRQSGLTFMSKGKEGVSPHRELAHVCLVWVDRPMWSPFIFAGTHLIVVKADGELEWRQEARADELDVMQESFARWRGKGLPVLVALDSNWSKMPKPIPEFRWVVQGGHNGIDKIGFANAPGANWDLGFVSHESYANAADHDFQVANLAATART